MAIVIVAARRPIDGPFELVLEGQRIAQSARFNVWSGGSHIRFQDPDRSITLSSPGDVQNIISVANYTTRISYQDAAGRTITFCEVVACPSQEQRIGSLNPSSSWGPTVDGRQTGRLNGAPGNSTPWPRYAARSR